MPSLKPLVKLTEKQWDRLLERVILRGAGKGAVKAGLPAEEAMGKAVKDVLGSEPLEKQVYGRLYNTMDMGGGEAVKQPMDYPWPEAVTRYIQGGGSLSAERNALPPVKVLKPPLGEVSGAANPFMDVGTQAEHPAFSDLKKQVIRSNMPGSYVEREYRPIKLDLNRAKKLKQAAEQEAKDRKRELIQKARSLAPVKKSAEKVMKGKINIAAPDTDALVNQAALLDNMWKFIGGKRTLTGRMWDEYRKSARGRFKVKDPRDYFYRVGLKWLADPERTAKAYKREVSSLESIYKNYVEALEGGSK